VGPLILTTGSRADRRDVPATMSVARPVTQDPKREVRWPTTQVHSRADGARGHGFVKKQGEVVPRFYARVRLSDGVRLGHVNIEVSDLRVARRFYDRFFSVLGFTRIQQSDKFWLGYKNGSISLWLTVSRPCRLRRSVPHVPTDGMRDPISDHLGLRARSSRRVFALEKALRKEGFRPIYASTKQPTPGSTWYTSNAWKDLDNNVFEIYAITRR
jgi:catechol 2,3-dioxygenase-like lactoylglutathione lyase family enzyme